MLSSYMISLAAGDLGIALNTQLSVEGTGLGIAVDAQLGSNSHFDVVVDPQSRAQTAPSSGSVLDQ